MTHKKKYITLFLGVLLLGVVVLINQSKASITKDEGTSDHLFRNYTFFATSTNQVLGYATTTNATSTNIISYFDSNNFLDSGYFVIRGAKKVEMYFSRGDTTGQGNNGTTTFRVQATPNGSDWYDFGKLVIATSTNQLTQAMVLASGTTTVVSALNLDFDTFYAIRCIVAEIGTADGEHSCSASAEW